MQTKKILKNTDTKPEKHIDERQPSINAIAMHQCHQQYTENISTDGLKISWMLLKTASKNRVLFVSLNSSSANLCLFTHACINHKFNGESEHVVKPKANEHFLNGSMDQTKKQSHWPLS